MVTHDRRFNRYASRTIELLDGALFEGRALAV
jgi:ABC-type lipoprotein export system ATPase subunit